eukprot:Polyplicarium_translucidae@DN3052_c0_g1_i3.p1
MLRENLHPGRWRKERLCARPGSSKQSRLSACQRPAYVSEHLSMKDVSAVSPLGQTSQYITRQLHQIDTAVTLICRGVFCENISSVSDEAVFDRHASHVLCVDT